jgi:hypothetical protein
LDPRSGVIDIVGADALTKRLFEVLLLYSIYFKTQSLTYGQTPDDLFKMNQPIEPIQIPEQAQMLAAGLKYDYITLQTRLHYSIRPNNKYAGAAPLPR